MNEPLTAAVLSPASDPAGLGGGPTITAGALLRQARETEGLHIAALAVALKVPVKKLEALESDRFDLLSDMVFTRALAGSFCRLLKVDPLPILARLPRADSPHLKTDETGINAPFRGSDGGGLGAKVMEWLRKPLGLSIFALLLASVVLLLLPELGWWGRWTSSPPLRVTTHSPSPIDLKPTPSIRPSPQVAMQPEASLVAPADATVNDATVNDATVNSLALAAPSSLAKPMAGQPVLLLKATGPSWVEVIDSQGVVQIRRVLKTSEEVSVVGLTPFSVVLGKSENIQVEVRGSPLRPPLAGQGKVVRFEVK